MKTTIYVEILPDNWPNYRNYPHSVKVGRIRKRRPDSSERHLFTPIEIDVDPVARYSLARGVTVTA